MAENDVVADNSNTAEDVALETTEKTEETVEETAEESIEEIKARLAEEQEARKKAEEYGKNQKIRAEKAEQLSKKASVGASTAQELSTKDVLALTKAAIHEDDIDEVVEFARFKKIPVSEALRSGTVKAMLAERDEQRKTANATSTGSARPGSHRISDETLEHNARSGKLPESDADIQRLLKRKMGLNKK